MCRLKNTATHLNLTVTGYLIKETRYIVDMVKVYALGTHVYLTISEKVTHLTNLPVSHSSENWFEDTVYVSSDQKWTNRNPVQVYLLSLWSWHCLGDTVFRADRLTYFLFLYIYTLFVTWKRKPHIYIMYKKGSKQKCGRKWWLTLISWPILSRGLFLVTSKIGIFWPIKIMMTQ